ncbi:MFS transporter [Candidatus Woesearchaeota archaeon]|nr:MFS transporter [Candidatus Woesearchaeota archaeon]
MDQIKKFYLTSFLKNQTYFTPIFIIFLQSHFLSLQEIFLIFTIGSIFSLLIEIPTGVLADLYGKRKTIIIGKLVLIIAYLGFGFSNTFWSFVMFQIIYELGNALRSGTETGFVYDYIEQNKTDKNKLPGYTEVKGKQKFYGRIGESLATLAGGLIASLLGFSWVFFIATIPAFLNFLLAVSFEKIKEAENKKISITESLNHVKDSIKYLYRHKFLVRLVLNITIFSGAIAAIDKYIQPYMKVTGVPIEIFGLIYSIGLLLSALAVRYSYLVEKNMGTIHTINMVTLLAAIPAIILGLGWISYIGIALLFLILIIENIRSPIANNLFNQNISSKQRATLESTLQLMKELGKSIILPIAGYLTGAFSMYTAILVLGIIILLNGLFLMIRNGEKHTKNKFSKLYKKN